MTNEEKKRNEIIENTSYNMFVEAGAGAGKTSLIVNRIINLLEKGINGQDVSPKEIVVITFTNKAAEELRARIIDEIKSKTSLDNKLKEIDQMNISTIHSFCNVLLREQGLTMGLPLDLQLLDNQEAITLKANYLDEYIKTISDSEWQRLESFISKERWQIRGDMEDLYNQIADLPMDTCFVIPDSETIHEYEYNKCHDRLVKAIYGDTTTKPLEETIKQSIKNCINEKKNKTEFDPTKLKLSEILNSDILYNKNKELLLIGKDLETLINLLSHSEENENQIILWLANIDSKNNLLKGGNNPFDKEKIDNEKKNLRDALRELVGKEIREMPKKLLDSIDNKDEFNNCQKTILNSPSYYKAIWGHAQNARIMYREKSPRQYVTNDRLLEYTRDMICNEENDSVLRFFANKYKSIFVDEFQDTDRIQESFIYRLACDPDDLNNLRDGALFLVGDPKQSIYRFRGAQPEVFFNVRRRMEKLKNAKVYSLFTNYRSSETVLDWINEKFEANIISNNIVEKGRYTRMDPNPNTIAPGSFPGTPIINGIYHVGCADALFDNGKYQSARKLYDHTYEYANTVATEYEKTDLEIDIKKVTNIITQLTQKKSDGTPVFNVIDNGSPRGIIYSDFLLIARYIEDMQKYADMLQSSGIPVVIDGKEDISTEHMLKVYIRLFKYLVNRKDAFSQVGAREALRTTLDITDEAELEELCTDILECLHYDTKNMTPYGKALYLENQLSAILKKDQIINSVDASKSQMLIRQMIETLCAEEGLDGITLANKMQEYINTKLEHELPAKPGVNAVRFMNLHKTKGLEGNIIIILNRTNEKRHNINNYRHNDMYYPGITPWAPIRNEEATLKQAEKERDMEFHRLEYVAVTRAKQAVIFMGVIKRGGLFATQEHEGSKITNTKFYPRVNEETYSFNINDTADIEKFIADNIITTSNDSDDKIDDPKEYLCSGDNYTYDLFVKQEEFPTLIFTSPSKLEVSTEKKKNTKDKKNSIKRPTGNIIGNVLHRTMELMVSKCYSITHYQLTSSFPEEKSLDRIIVSCVNQSIEEEYDHLESLEKKEAGTIESTRKFIKICAKSFSNYLSSIWTDIDEIYPEVCFSYMKDTNEWMNGTADLIIKQKNGNYLLIDYKSDSDINVSEADMVNYLIKKYTPQLNEYKSVISNLLGADTNNIETVLVSFSLKDEVGEPLKTDNVRLRLTKV